MQQPKRRSKRGVILLAVVAALLVMAVVPAVALAADTVTVNDGKAFATDYTFKVSYSSTTADRVTFEVRGRHGTAGSWSNWYDIPSSFTVYSFTTSASRNLKLEMGIPPGFWYDGDQFQIRGEFWNSSNPLVWTEAFSQIVELDFSQPPVSLLEFSPAGHPGRTGINWTNGDSDYNVWFQFGLEAPGANMGITHWQMSKNNDAAKVMTPITWSPWGTSAWPAPFVGIGLPDASGLIPKPKFNDYDSFWHQNDGVYTVTHWAVDKNGLDQQEILDPTVSVIGYDTKSPYVVWNWPATGNTTDYYTKDIAVSGEIIDDGGSGVAGYFADPRSNWVSFAPEAHVYWRSAETGGAWALWEDWGYTASTSWSNIKSKQNRANPYYLNLQINAFDQFRYHLSGTIYVYPNYNAEYCVAVTGSDFAGNGGFPWDDYEIPVAPAAAKAAGPSGNFIGVGFPGSNVVVDNMPPSTVFTADPVGTALPAPSYDAWTNQNITINFIASDAGGSGIGSGVAYTEYILGNSSTTPPLISASGTKGTSVTIKDTAPVGPVYVWYRSVDNAGNKEAWNLAWAWLDNKAPVLSITGNQYWYNAEFAVRLSATDNNSHLATPGIEFQVPNWPMPFLLPHSGSRIPTAWAALSQNPGLVTFPVDAYPNSRTDGIWPLQFRATDQAGNAAEVTTQTVKIDTRPPESAVSTFGADKWVNGTKAINIVATDQNPGAGVAVTWYRSDQATPWTANAAATPAATLETGVSFSSPVQGSVHTIDYFSIDGSTNPAAIEAGPTKAPYPGNVEKGVVVGWAPIPGHPYINITSVTGYKSSTVKLDVTAPTVTAMDPKNGNWQKPLATVNFAGTDVGSGYAYTQWSTDGGQTWTKGEQAQVGGDGVTTITYRGVDNVGLMSANQTIEVKVASTPPTVTAQNATMKATKKNAAPTITFNITAVTPTATAVIQIRTLSGKTLSTHRYANVPTGQDVSKRFTMNTGLKAGKYNIRVGAIDEAGNVETKKGAARLTVTK